MCASEQQKWDMKCMSHFCLIISQATNFNFGVSLINRTLEGKLNTLLKPAWKKHDKLHYRILKIQYRI